MKKHKKIPDESLDAEWRVEQKLAKVLAERDLYIDGFLYGLLTALFVGAIAVLLWPEIKNSFSGRVA